MTPNPPFNFVFFTGHDVKVTILVDVVKNGMIVFDAFSGAGNGMHAPTASKWIPGVLQPDDAMEIFGPIGCYSQIDVCRHHQGHRARRRGYRRPAGTAMVIGCQDRFPFSPIGNCRNQMTLRF